jgi:tetrahydromethanopterin S-methyltransferase subunit H
MQISHSAPTGDSHARPAAVATPRELQLGGRRIGGAFGTRPPFLAGSVFYDKHSVVNDPLAGVFDERRAGVLVDQLAALEERYGVTQAVDVVAATPQAMERYLVFVLRRTQLPVMINATDAETRIAGLEVSARAGQLGRCVYASLTEDVVEDEIEALKAHPPAVVMVLANDIANPTPEGCVAMIERIYRPLLEELGIAVPLVDVGTLDSPSVGLSMRSVKMVRERLGYPAGCAFSNCFPQWDALNAMGCEWVDVSLAATIAAVRMAGADFLHYGLIATSEVYLGFAARELDGAILPAGHPLSNMFRSWQSGRP